MQAFTIFFGIAIVAIAMENFTAKFLIGKTSDAGAKGDQEFQSRAEGTRMRYWLRGKTGTEKVIIRDGTKIEPLTLKKDDQPFIANNSMITIEFTNDECCDPDKNVLFTPRYKYRVSTKDNDFPTNYLEKWNCGNCSTSDSRKMDLQSSDQKVDLCHLLRKDDVSDCTKCRLVKDGQFCYPGNYTVEFKTENQCEGVTYGGCDNAKNILDTEEGVKTAQRCNELCVDYAGCGFYRYDGQKEVCYLLELKYRKDHCNIKAGPVDKTVTACINIDNNKTCDSILHEDCEYNGELLKNLPDGQVLTADNCQHNCELRAPDCKYWIYYIDLARCVLKRSGKKTCSVESGPPMKKNDYEYCLSIYHN